MSEGLLLSNPYRVLVIGASGAILAVRLFHDLTAGHGLAAIASAGGIGSAILFSA